LMPGTSGGSGRGNRIARIVPHGKVDTNSWSISNGAEEPTIKNCLVTKRDHGKTAEDHERRGENQNPEILSREWSQSTERGRERERETERENGRERDRLECGGDIKAGVVSIQLVIEILFQDLVDAIATVAHNEFSKLLDF
jgi:antitoxin (DNA-binding transcriptional repressor) of toxin-antitoxin stability system